MLAPAELKHVNDEEDLVLGEARAEHLLAGELVAVAELLAHEPVHDLDEAHVCLCRELIARGGKPRSDCARGVQERIVE